MSDKKIAYLRQFISQFIQGPNVDSILESVADQLQKLEQVSISVNDQMTIIASSGVYTDKRLAELNITRPPELGMDDLAFKKMGIQVNAAKQITEAIHTVLATFYGDDAVRASTTSTIAGPYDFEDGDELRFVLESGEEYIVTMQEDFFDNINIATVEETVDVITRFIRGLGLDGYAKVFLDVDTGLKYVRIFGGAKGPYSFVQVRGGEVQNKLEFAEARDTELPANDTVWEITRNAGSTHRFRWVSGSSPLLDRILPGDRVMIYGNQFASVGINGTFDVTSVRPPASIPAVNAGYFEISIPNFSALASSQPDMNPPANTLTVTYSFTVTQSEFDDLKFFLPKRNTPYNQIRYALAWEPEDALLKIYMPATTMVVRRDLIGSAHLHLLYSKDDFDGSFGHASDPEQKIQVMSDYSIQYRQAGQDNYATGGTLSYGPTLDIDYITRENGYTKVFTKTPHGITGSADAWGRILSTTIVTIDVEAPEDLTTEPFLGPYVVDPAAPYTLTDQFVTLREKIVAGSGRNSLIVQGTMPNAEGLLLFDLNKDTQEGAVRYFASQALSNPVPVNIQSISQVGTNVTVVTDGPHGLIANQQTTIAGTVNFNGLRTVVSAPNLNTFTFTKTPSATLLENVGTSTAILNGPVTTLTLDPSYEFQFPHEVGDDVTLISSERAYEPSPTGEDYGFYATGTAEGRVFAQRLMEQITALGIRLEMNIIFPNDIGLGNMGEGTDENDPPVSEATFVWGT